MTSWPSVKAIFWIWPSTRAVTVTVFRACTVPRPVSVIGTSCRMAVAVSTSTSGGALASGTGVAFAGTSFHQVQPTAPIAPMAMRGRRVRNFILIPASAECGSAT